MSEVLDDRQREAERTALKKVRGLLDDIKTQEARERIFKRRVLIVGPIIVVAVLASFVAFVRLKHQPQNAPQVASTVPVQRYTDPEKYAFAVRQRVALKLHTPPNVPDSAQTVVHLAIAESGAIANLRIAQSSGIAAYDEAVKQAILGSAPFPILVDQADLAKPKSLELVVRAR